MKKSPPVRTDFEALLGPGGPLSLETFYEYRPGQMSMTRAVWKTLDKNGALMVEAGTGTGKSLAYLLPSLALEHRVVISTRTKALQEQLARKDLPLCEKLLGRPLKAAIVKGRANYLCLHYWERFLKEPLFRNRMEARLLPRLKAWANGTKTGDKAEWSAIPEALALWHDVNARAERCLGSNCPLFKECFITKLRREAEAAELVVTNHHLLFADLAIKVQWQAAALPEYEHLVIDEAHEAEDAATSFFGFRASRRMLQEWFHDAGMLFRSAAISAARSTLADSEQAASLFFGLLQGRGAGGLQGGRISYRKGALDQGLLSLKVRLATSLDAASLAIDSGKENPEESRGLLERLERWRESLDFVLEGEDDAYVRWIEKSDRNVTLGASPIEVGSLLEKTLYGRLRSVIFTSATLTVGGSFSYFRRRLGIPADATELSIPSPFDYQNQGLFYVPSSFPLPADPSFQQALIGAVRGLIELSRGRAFVLCTSFKNMRAVADAVRDLPYAILVQGEDSKGKLLERFKKDGNAVLVATSSFWQGVDVQGEALSLVVLDKIPFAVPSDPIVAARIERLRKEGANPFGEYQVPLAAITLKQGAGRLIRSRRDRGVVACLDVRLRQKAYGATILSSLPPFRAANELTNVEAFFGKKEALGEQPGKPE